MITQSIFDFRFWIFDSAWINTEYKNHFAPRGFECEFGLHLLNKVQVADLRSLPTDNGWFKPVQPFNRFLAQFKSFQERIR